MVASWFSPLVRNNIERSVAPKRWDDLFKKLPTHLGKVFKQNNPRRQEGDPRIIKLFVHDDHHVFIGHGDWNINDGPTMLVSLDPHTGEYTDHGLYETESFEKFYRTSWGETLALCTDGTGFWEPMIPFATYPAREVGKLNSIHIFDAAEHDDKLWVCGSALNAQGQGVASTWWSTDRGLTWKQEVVTGVPGDFQRTHNLEVYDGYLYADSPSGWSKWSGTSWELQPEGSAPYFDTSDYLPWIEVNVPNASYWEYAGNYIVVGTYAGEIYTRRLW